MSNAQDRSAAIREIARGFRGVAGGLLPALHTVQSEFGYIPDDGIEHIADELNLSRADVYGVVTFYHDFRTESPAKHVVEICRAEACQAVGARALEASLSEAIAQRDDVELRAVYCLGNCACGPSLRINGKVLGRVSAAHADEVVPKDE